MITVAAAEARTRIAELLDRAERGETVVITRDGQPAAIDPDHGTRVSEAMDRLERGRLILKQMGARLSHEEILALRDQGRP